jgi:hypothetical protein
MDLSSILNNSWFTGIVAGVISSLLVYYLTDFLLKKKVNKEYLQKITLANNEILYTLRPLIVQQKIPSKQILNSLFEATSRKYGVKLTDVYSLEMLVDDLTKEVMDNVFLPAEQKYAFCKSINELKIDDGLNELYDKFFYEEEKNKISINYVSYLLSIVVGLLIASATFFTSFFQENYDKFSSDYEFIFWSLGTVSIIVTITLLSFSIQAKLKKLTSNNKNKLG